MGVNSIQPGQAYTRLPTGDDAQAPAPQLRTAEAAPVKALRSQESPEPEKGQVQRAAGPDGSAPVIMNAVTRFRVDHSSNEIITQVVDREGRVIRQIPPEEMMKIAAQFQKFQGMLFDELT